MGQVDCHCLQKQTSVPLEEHLDSRDIRKKVQQITRSNNARIASITKPITSRSDVSDKPAKSKPCHSIIIWLRNMRQPDKSIKIEVLDPTVEQELFEVGTQLTCDKYKVKKENEDDNFLISIKYIGNQSSDGVFYMKDEGVGLGCFYALRHPSKLELKSKMLINIGNQFMVPYANSKNLDDSLMTNNDSLDMKIYGGCAQGEIYSLDPRTNVHYIGKSLECHLVLQDSQLSNVHCRIVREEDKWYISDGLEAQKSNKGTWIYAGSTIRMEEGMMLKCGGTYLLVEIKRL